LAVRTDLLDELTAEELVDQMELYLVEMKAN
jgi:hypothetical protein